MQVVPCTLMICTFGREQNKHICFRTPYSPCLLNKSVWFVGAQWTEQRLRLVVTLVETLKSLVGSVQLAQNLWNHWISGVINTNTEMRGMQNHWNH